MAEVIDITDRQREQDLGPIPDGFTSWEAYHKHAGCYDCIAAYKPRLGKGPCCTGIMSVVYGSAEEAVKELGALPKYNKPDFSV